MPKSLDLQGFAGIVESVETVDKPSLTKVKK